jgi:hypothetical protein
MFSLLHSLTAGELFRQQLPVFALSFLIAEFFYKFGSFALECVAFLATWYVLDAAIHWFLPKRSDPLRAGGQKGLNDAKCD